MTYRPGQFTDQFDKPEPAPFTREYYVRLVKSSVRSNDADLIGRIADKCLEETLAFRNGSVWHCTSLITGNKCHCAQCAA